MVKRMLCDSGKKLFYIENGCLYSGKKSSRTFVKPSTIVKHGLVEESFKMRRGELG